MTDIVLYTGPNCGYCSRAKQLLAARGFSFVEVDLGAEPERIDEMIERSGKRTVPQIFIGDRHVGGYRELMQLDAEGGLASLSADETASPSSEGKE